MVQGKAKAVVAGRTIAETDEYEIVEGNIYVRQLIAKSSTCMLIVDSSHHRMLLYVYRDNAVTNKSKLRQLVVIVQDGPHNTLPLEGRCCLLYHQPG